MDCDVGTATEEPTDQVTDTDEGGEDSGDKSAFRSKYQGDYSELNMESTTTHDLMYWSWQVSRGMEYLEQRKVTERVNLWLPRDP